MDDICIGEVTYLRENGGLLFPDVEETLKELSINYDLFIVSNCQDGYADAFMDYHGLRKYFKDYETNGKTKLSKTENIKLILDRNNLKEAVYIGDTTGDEISARLTGISFIHAAYCFGKVISPDLVVNSLKDLVKQASKAFKKYNKETPASLQTGVSFWCDYHFYT